MGFKALVLLSNPAAMRLLECRLTLRHRFYSTSSLQLGKLLRGHDHRINAAVCSFNQCGEKLAHSAVFSQRRN